MYTCRSEECAIQPACLGSIDQDVALSNSWGCAPVFAAVLSEWEAEI